MVVLKVYGMHCPSCKMLIEEALEDAGCKNIQVAYDPETQNGQVKCDTKLSKEKLTQIIEGEGEYKVKKDED